MSQTGCNCLGTPSKIGTTSFTPRHQGLQGYGRVSGKGEGRHHRSGRHRRRVDRPSPDRARLGRHRRHRQVGHPTDIGSTAHASDFCYTTSHDFLSCWTTKYSIDFYEKMGHYARIGGLEVARVGDDARMDEIKRKVSSGKAFGTRARLIDPPKSRPEIPADRGRAGPGRPVGPGRRPRHPALADGCRQAGRCGREKSGKLLLRQHAGEVAGHRQRPHQGRRHRPRHDHGRSRGGLRRPLGPADRRNGGEDLPVMPVDHPLTFFGPYNEFAGTGKEIGYPLLRDQGNSAYMRDTGDPKTSEGGQIEWGYYEEKNPRCAIRATCSKSTGAPVALAARPRHGADHRAAGARHRADAHPRRTRL
jgi:hypothetical protein